MQKENRLRRRAPGNSRSMDFQAGTPRAVLFDRDGTLVVDVPYNGDPKRVTPMPTVRTALRMLRTAGIRTGVVSNQSGIDRGIVTAEQVAAVNARIDALLGPFDIRKVCPHNTDENCACRKPKPGMIINAAREAVRALQIAAAAGFALPAERTRRRGDRWYRHEDHGMGSSRRLVGCVPARQP